jgi:hypothetical protein
MQLEWMKLDADEDDLVGGVVLEKGKLLLRSPRDGLKRIVQLVPKNMNPLLYD